MSDIPPSSLSPPQGSSRSSSPGATDKPRAVSGSLKDRIAKFNNPGSSPLAPTLPFGQAGPAHFSSSHVRGGLVGNRLPTLDPKTAGFIGGPRRTSENKGLIGNRIPSMGNVPKQPGVRSASPAGSVDSSAASGAAGSPTSPVDSRLSSPPTSPGGDLPSTYLASTLPDDGGPGAATPSSTVAEAGEETSELSVPSTPLAGGVHSDLPPDMTSPQYDLVPSNLTLAAAEQMQHHHGLSAPLASRAFAPSVSSSLATQYTTTSGEGEEKKTMMEDVSGISTPDGTPRAAQRDLEGSARGEGSVAGDVDMEDLGARLGGLSTDARDREATPGPFKEEDPKEAPDLDALNSGELRSEPMRRQHTVEQNPVNDMAEMSSGQMMAEHVIPNSDKKVQSGVADGRLEDMEEPTGAEPPKSENGKYNENDGLNVREAMPAGTKGATQWFESTYGKDGAKDSEAKQEGIPAEEPDHGKVNGAEDEDEDGTTPPADGAIPTVQDSTAEADAPSTVQKIGDAAIILPSPGPADRDANATLENKPVQVHLEPAPIAQPAVPTQPAGESTPISQPAELDEAATTGIASPTFPHAPDDDPDTLDPLDNRGSSLTGTSTPLDPAFLKTFPEVPDEAKPRVQVHVSSPANTPSKPKSGSNSVHETPLADLPGRSKSLSNLAAEDEQSGGLDEDANPQARERLAKRLSTRKSPKSPLLDDEDPGDFEPGEGWAVVTKGRGSA